jgi:hypothetical protein
MKLYHEIEEDLKNLIPCKLSPEQVEQFVRYIRKVEKDATELEREIWLKLKRKYEL